MFRRRCVRAIFRTRAAGQSDGTAQVQPLSLYCRQARPLRRACLGVIRAWVVSVCSVALAVAGSAFAGSANAQTSAHSPAAHAGAASPARSPAGAASATSSAGRRDYRRACVVTKRSGQMACMALVRTNIRQRSQRSLGAGTAPTGDGYGPSSLLSAYKLPSTGGTGQTVAIVDAFDDPNAAADLATYRSDWGLPACGAGCFQKVNQDGQATPLPTAAGTTGWASEESLDLDMVSAICPNCHIILVEAKSASVTDLGTGVDSAIRLGANFVSNSYGGSESSADPTYDSDYYNHPGVAITASAGDNGYGVSYPAASRYVTAVGGTSLSPASNSRGWNETVWGGTGSGCSADDAKPLWQTDSCSKRTDNDIAAVADPNTGVAIYDSYDQSGWLEEGGTSVSSPIIAAMYALAGPPAPGTYPSSYIYRNTSSLFDITSGTNTLICFIYLCAGENGYDGPTGWGTPDGLGALRPPAQDLLRSGSFENSAAGWTTFTPAGGTVNMVNYNTARGAPATAQDGSGYLAFNTNIPGGSVYQDVTANARAGASYVATAWLAAQSGTASGTLCLWGLGVNTDNCRPYTVGGAYTQIQVVYDVPADIRNLRFQVYAAPGGGTTDMDTASLAQNLLQSGSFENSTTGWNTTIEPPGGTVNMVDYNTAHGAPAIAHDGNGYLAFNTSSTGGGVYQNVPANATAGTSYVATAWLSAQSGTTTGTLCLGGFGTTNTDNCHPYSVTAGTYTPVQVTYDAPQNITALRLRLYPTPNGGTTDMDTASLAQNMLQTGSFENSTTGWTTYTPPGGTTNIVNYNTAHGAPATAQDGTGYLAFNTNEAPTNVYQDVTVSAPAGTPFIATAWLAAQSGTASGIACVRGLPAQTISCRPYAVGTSYTPIQIAYDAPAGLTTLRVQIYPAAGGGTTDLDTVSLG
jgi:hypothetical protein